jgi:hypothetical protein
MTWCSTEHRENFTLKKFIFVRIQFGGGWCEHGNEPQGSIKGEKFLDKLSDCRCLKKDCASAWCHLVEAGINVEDEVPSYYLLRFSVLSHINFRNMFMVHSV